MDVQPGPVPPLRPSRADRSNALYGLEDRDDRPRPCRTGAAGTRRRSIAGQTPDRRVSHHRPAVGGGVREASGRPDSSTNSIASRRQPITSLPGRCSTTPCRAGETEPAYAAELNEIIELLAAKRAILETPHSESRVQIPALLLGGMTLRRLNDHHKAREFFDRTRVVAERLDDADELAGIQWALVLVDLESVRNDRDDGRWSAAETGLARLRRRPTPSTVELDSTPSSQACGRHSGTFRADRPEPKPRKRPPAATMHVLPRLGALIWRALAEESPSRRDDLYAVLFRSPQDAAPESLDAIDRVASMAGLLAPARDGAAATGDSRRPRDRDRRKFA